MAIPAASVMTVAAPFLHRTFLVAATVLATASRTARTLRTVVSCCGDDGGRISSPSLPRACEGFGCREQFSKIVADGGGNAADDRVNGLAVGLVTVQHKGRLTLPKHCHTHL